MKVDAYPDSGENIQDRIRTLVFTASDDTDPATLAKFYHALFRRNLGALVYIEGQIRFCDGLRSRLARPKRPRRARS